jgi:hypothetical protein
MRRAWRAKGGQRMQRVARFPDTPPDILVEPIVGWGGGARVLVR